MNFDVLEFDGAIAPSLAPDQWGPTGAPTTTGLTYGYVGGTAINSSGAAIAVAAGTVALANNATNYVERDYDGTVRVNQTGWSPTRVPMAVVTTVAGAITAHQDARPHYGPFPRVIGDVRRYGGAGDGVTVEDSAFSRAMTDVGKSGAYGTNAGQGTRILAPSGEFLINSAINMTGSQKNLRGEGPYQTTIHGNTGGSGSGVAIDMSQSGFSTVRDILLDVLAHGGGALANPSRIGILQARNAANVQANNNNLYDVVVRLGHDATAFTNRGTVALYNCCCENTAYRNVTLMGDVGLFIGVGNLYGVVSPVIGTIGTNSSMTVVTVDGTSFIMGISGPAVRINGASLIDLADTSLFTAASQFSVTPYQYAIELLAQTTGLKYRGSVEAFSSVMSVSSILTGPTIDCYAAHDPSTANPRIHLVGGAGIVGGHISVIPTPGTLNTGSGTPSGNLIDCVNGQAAFLEGVDIELFGQGINLGTNGQILSCRIRSCDTVANTMGRIVAGGGMAGNEILCTDGYVLA